MQTAKLFVNESLPGSVEPPNLTGEIQEKVKTYLLGYRLRYDQVLETHLEESGVADLGQKDEWARVADNEHLQTAHGFEVREGVFLGQEKAATKVRVKFCAEAQEVLPR